MISNLVHHVEDVLMLRLDLNADLFALIVQNFLKFDEIELLACLRQQDHVEETVHDVLIDARNIDVVIGEYFRHGGDDADTRSRPTTVTTNFIVAPSN